MLWRTVPAAYNRKCALYTFATACLHFSLWLMHKEADQKPHGFILILLITLHIISDHLCVQYKQQQFTNIQKKKKKKHKKNNPRPPETSSPTLVCPLGVVG
eukprot:TRINITY_DN19214_c0_g1_i2.p3 TRINITY_DN19214_c0_g1~~TRINITY_DN19214_c0_g1_i2.p3  ORF type:complete len:101 (+),score=13.58 TRINITY_DN19214_c0_g1_i2:302-604(+)